MDEWMELQQKEKRFFFYMKKSEFLMVAVQRIKL